MWHCLKGYTLLHVSIILSGSEKTAVDAGDEESLCHEQYLSVPVLLLEHKHLNVSIYAPFPCF